IVARLAPDVERAHHGALARALENEPGVDAEALANHFFAAGDRARAAVHAERAADEAVAKGAFDQAVRLYGLALATIDAASPDAQRLRVRLAHTLTLAGRGAEAATAFHAAAAGASRVERVELELEAADQLIASGHIDEGLEAMRRLSRVLGVRIPS